MNIRLQEITIRELIQNYADNQENGVKAYGGLLDVRPPYQREFVYGDKERIAANDTDLAVATALCGRQAGKQLIYLEAGSGADNPVPPETIRAVSRMLDVPLVVGGGITTTQALRCAYAAGADLVVVGNHFESRLDDLTVFVETAHNL